MFCFILGFIADKIHKFLLCCIYANNARKLCTEAAARFILRLFYFSIMLQIHAFVVLVLRLLVGAPRAKALNRQTSIITGGLYKCDITQSTGCERVQFDNEGEEPTCMYLTTRAICLNTIYLLLFQRGHTT